MLIYGAYWSLCTHLDIYTYLGLFFIYVSVYDRLQIFIKNVCCCVKVFSAVLIAVGIYAKIAKETGIYYV